MDGDLVYLKVHTGRYIGELDGTSRKEWVKARGKSKGAQHALQIEKKSGGAICSGDEVYLAVTAGRRRLSIECFDGAVRAREYNPRGDAQRLVISKLDADGGEPIACGDLVFLRGFQGMYIDANPLEKAPDGELKCRWPDEGDWQVMTIEK